MKTINNYNSFHEKNTTGKNQDTPVIIEKQAINNDKKTIPAVESLRFPSVKQYSAVSYFHENLGGEW